MVTSLHSIPLLLSLAIPQVQQDTLAVSWQHVTMRVEPAKPSFVAGEPVTLFVQLQNTGERPVAFHTANLGVEHQTIAVHITPPRGESVEYTREFVIEPSAPSFGLGPGDTISFIQTLHWNATTGQYAFPEPGEYGVTVQVHNLAGAMHLRSERAGLLITLPERNEDREIAGLMTNEQTSGVLMGTSEPDVQTLRLLQAAVDRYPRSTFTPYIHYALGLYYRNEHFERRPDPERARINLDLCLQTEDTMFPLRHRVLNLMARDAVRAGDFSEARRLLDEADRIRPNDLTTMRLRQVVRPNGA